MTNRQEIHKQVIEHYGWVSQLGKLSEELREFDKEIWKYLNSPNNKEELLGEFADVLNMCEQFKIIVTEMENIFTLDEIEIVQDFKMFRTKKIIENISREG